MQHNKRLYNVDFLRLFFVILIVYYHIIPHDYIQSNNLSVLISMNINSRWVGTIGNAALFIISGYFLAFSFDKKDKNFLQFAFHKLMRFYPTLCFAVLCMGALSILHLVKFNVGQNILNLFLITQNGTSLTSQLTNLNATWFVCSLFWCSLFYFALYSIINDEYKFNFVVSIISYFGAVLYINSNLRDFQIIFGIFSKSGSIAISMIGLGILLRNFLIKIENIKINYWLATLLESLLLFYLLHGFLIKKFKETYLVIVIACCALFVLFILQQGVISRFFNKKWIGNLSQYAFSIYIMQEVSFIGVKKIWMLFKVGTTNSAILMIIFSLLICISVGILTYHIIEKPITNYYQRRLSK